MLFLYHTLFDFEKNEHNEHKERENKMIQLFTDTSANLPAKLTQENGIKVIPFQYFINGKQISYSEKTDFNGKEFYDAMRAGADVKTSMINMAEFTESFEESLIKGDDVIYVGMSGGISGTANAAAVVAEELSQKYPQRKIAAIDTCAASLGEGLLVLEAAEMIQKGASFETIKNYICFRKKEMRQYFTVDDLEYLKRGGRISGAAALIGSILGIKPMLTADEQGHIIMCGKARGAKKVLDGLAEKYEKMVADKNANIGIAHADNDKGVDYLLEKLRECGFSGECLRVCYEPVTGAHVGPGTVALFFFGNTQK